MDITRCWKVLAREGEPDKLWLLLWGTFALKPPTSRLPRLSLYPLRFCHPEARQLLGHLGAFQHVQLEVMPSLLAFQSPCLPIFTGPSNLLPVMTGSVHVCLSRSFASSWKERSKIRIVFLSHIRGSIITK